MGRSCTWVFLTIIFVALTAKSACALDINKLHKVNHLVEKHKFDEAAPLARALIIRSPKNGSLRAVYSQILINQRQFKEAYKQARYAVHLSPNYAEAYIILSDCASSIGKCKEAVWALNKYKSIKTDAKNIELVDSLIKFLEDKIAHEKNVTTISPPGTYLALVTINGVRRFAHEKMPLKVYIQPVSNCKGFNPLFVQLVKEGCQKWQTASKQIVRFIFVDKAEGADIKFSWTDDKSKLVYLCEGGHNIDYDNPDGTRKYSEIVIYTMMGEKPSTKEEIERVVLHEIGHTIGLNGYSNNPFDVMSLAFESGAVLSSNDVRTLRSIYRMKTGIVTTPVYRSGVSNSSINSAKAITHYNSGTKLLGESKFEPAIVELRRAIALDPSMDSAYINLSAAQHNAGIGYAKQNKFDMAEKYMRDAIDSIKKCKKDNKNKLILYLTNYKNVLLGKGKTKEADDISYQLRRLGVR